MAGVRTHGGLWFAVSVPETFQRLGAIQPSAAGPGLAVFTLWKSLGAEVLIQWRWDHDRRALLLEEQEAANRSRAEQAQAAEQRQADLDLLTLESLRKKRRFSNWKGDRPDKAIAACRAACRDAIDALISLGRKPKKRAIATVIRCCIEQ